MTELEQILMERDGLSKDEVEELIQEARERVANGEDPETILFEEFGLEPDFVFDLL